VAVAAVGTIVLGIYPRFLFDIAATSAASLGVVKRPFLLSSLPPC
jgi:hypothetical protein